MYHGIRRILASTSIQVPVINMITRAQGTDDLPLSFFIYSFLFVVKTEELTNPNRMGISGIIFRLMLIPTPT